MSSPLDIDFAQLVAQLDYSMFIVTAADQGEPSGCLVGFASQVSIDPPRFLACVSVKNHTYRVAQAADTLVVHMVGQGQEDLAELFGGQTGDEVDKFARCQWTAGPGGAPVLAELENWFAGQILQRLPFGDHVGFLLQPIEAHRRRAEESFTFRRAKWIDPGHEA